MYEIDFELYEGCRPFNEGIYVLGEVTESVKLVCHSTKDFFEIQGESISQNAFSALTQSQGACLSGTIFPQAVWPEVKRSFEKDYYSKRKYFDDSVFVDFVKFLGNLF